MKTIAICLAALLGLVAAEAAIAGNYEILYDTRNGDAWFGGDDRATSNPRSAGGGQSVLVDSDILLESFSFYFVWWFDYRDNPDGAGHAVTLTLHVRDSAGTVLKTVTVDVDASFNSGWITWTGIDLDVTAGTTLIFTSCLNGAYDANQYTNFQGADVDGGYADGQRYSKNGTDDASMALWAGWVTSTWDSMFWLQGSTPVPIETTSWGALKAAFAGRD
jgi:hypothetical protein